MAGKLNRTGADFEKSTAEKRQAHVTISFGKHYHSVLKRLLDIVNRHPNSTSLSGLIVISCAACIDTLEKEIPTSRRFKLNGKTVEV